MKKHVLITILLSFILECNFSFSQQQKVSIDFNSEKFQIVQGEVIEYLGRTAFKGFGIISDLNFKNGVIEVDMAVTGGRSYPGVNFRMQSEIDFEHFYIRPHRAGLYPDALQYTPCTNGVDSWQLFNGDGITESVVIPNNEWFHVKLEVKDSQAQVFINNKEQPALEIFELYHGISQGSISLSGPLDNSAYFSNLSYHETDDLILKAPPVKNTPIGFISDWEISQPYGILDVEFDKTPIQPLTLKRTHLWK